MSDKMSKICAFYTLRSHFYPYYAHICQYIVLNASVIESMIYADKNIPNTSLYELAGLYWSKNNGQVNKVKYLHFA